MPDSITDPATGIVIPTPEQRSGPQYAEDISNALLTLAHLTHTGASNSDGYQIPSAGIDFDEDLSAQSNNLTTLRSTRFVNHPSVLNGVGDLNCVYFVNGDAYVNDGSGTPIQLTSGGGISTVSSNNLNTLSLSANHTVAASDTDAVFNYTSWSGTRIITFPLANTVPAGRFYYIKDASVDANHYTSDTITINPSGSDTVDGGANYILKLAYSSVLIMSDGVSNWTVHSFQPSNVIGPTVDIVATVGRALLSADAGYASVQGATDVNIGAVNDVNIEAVNNLILNATNDISMVATRDTGITGTRKLTLAGQMFMPVKAITSGPYTVDTTTKDYILLVDTTSGAITITLPSAADNGRVLIIKGVVDLTTNNITLARAGGTGSIEALAADYVMDGINQGVTLTCYGGDWFIVSTC